MTKRSHDTHPNTVPVQIVSQVDGDEHTRGTRVDTHVVCRVVEEFGSGITLHVVRVVVAPSKLDVDPILLGRSRVHNIPGGNKRGGEEGRWEEERERERKREGKGGKYGRKANS